MIDLGDIVTAGGVMAWVDVGLLPVGRLRGEAVREETARFVRLDRWAGETPHVVALTARQAHRDAAVRKAQDLIHGRDGQGVALASVAAAAGLGSRTLIRRFASASGMTPMERARAVRLARARELLVSGLRPPRHVAASLGHAELGSFSRAFRRAHGLAPGEVRRQAGGGRPGRTSPRTRSVGPP